MHSKNLFHLFDQLLSDGGFVLPMLLLCAAGVWWFLGARAALILTPLSSNEDIWKSSEGKNRPEGILAGLSYELRALEQEKRDRLRVQSIWTRNAIKLQKNRKLILTIIAIAPLLGLLGTVTGMIETFQGLGENSLYSQSGGVAGGIAEALLTTQMGLLVAAPAILMSRCLDRRAELLELQMLNFVKWVPKCEE